MEESGDWALGIKATAGHRFAQLPDELREIRLTSIIAVAR